MALRGITPFERTNAAMAQLVERVLGKDEVTGDAFCRKFVKRKGVGQNAIPSQNEAKLILLLSVVIVLLLTIPVSSSKLDRVEPGEIGSSRSFFA